MKEILFMIPSLGGGGAEKVLVTLLNSLDKNKYDITLYCLFDDGMNKQYISERITYKYLWKRTFKGNIHLLKFLSPRKLYEKLIKKKYDIIVSYLEGPTTRIVSGCPHPETKLISFVHTAAHDRKGFIRSYRNEKEFISSYNNYDKIVFVSKSVKEKFEIVYPEIRTLLDVKYNSVDDTYIQDLSLNFSGELPYEEGTINLISVGRYTHVKGYIRLISIIKELTKKGYLNIHLYLLGEGELEETYKSLISRHQLEEFITLLGYQNNPYKYVRHADLFVCSSYNEGFSTAVTESLILGTPVITTECSGMEELLGSDNHYGIITENTEESLHSGLRKLLDSPELLEYYQFKAEERGKSFKLTKTVQQIELLLDNIMKSKKR